MCYLAPQTFVQYSYFYKDQGSDNKFGTDAKIAAAGSIVYMVSDACKQGAVGSVDV